MSKNQPIVISIDGNIGSGKSTFMKKLKEKFADNPDVYFVEEPLDQWHKIKTKDGKNLIENYYSDMKRYAYIFQNFAYITRLRILYDAVHNSGASVIVTERSVESDRYLFAKMLYESELMNDLEWQVYLSWYGFLNINVDKIIYIKTDVDNCVDRIKKRARDGEDKISKEYLTQLDGKHEEWLSDRKNVVILDGNKNIYDDIVFKEHVETINIV